MPPRDIQKKLKVNQKINILKNFIVDNKSTKLSDLVSPDFALSEKLSYIKKELDSLKVLETIANRIFNSEQLVLDINAKKLEIRDKYPSIAQKHDSFRKLDAAKNNLEEEIKKPQQTRNESVIAKAEEELKTQTILVLKKQLENNKENLPAAIELDNLTSNDLLCIARYFWLKEQCKENSNAEAIENLIKENINTQAETDVTGSSHAVLGHITLGDLVRIKNWNNFKLNFQKQLEEQLTKLRSQKNESAASREEPSETLDKENLKLLEEVNELKLKITSLETELSNAYSKPEEAKTLLSHSEATDLSNEKLISLKEQNDEIITLNNQLLAENERNKTLSEEIDTHKHKNDKLEKACASLKNDLEKYKSELDTKEKQIAENSTKIKDYELQFNQKEQELIQNKSDLEIKSSKIKKLSEDLADTAKKLDEKNQEINQKESELIDLNNKNHQLELKIQQLNDKLKKLENQSKLDQANLTSKTHDTNYRISQLESDINEKKLALEQLRNEFDGSKKIVNEYKHQINVLKTDLELKAQALTESKSQLQTLTEQSEKLSAQKNILEQYKTELADSLAKYKALKAQLSTTTQDLGVKLTELHEKNISIEKDNNVLKENLEFFKMSFEKEKDALLTAKKEILELKNALSSTQTNLTTINQDFKSQLESAQEEKEKHLKEYNLFISEVNSILYNITDKDSEIPFSSLKSNNLIDSTEEFNHLITKIKSFKARVDASDALEDEIFQLKLSQGVLENENTKQLAGEIETLQNQIQELLEKNESLKEQNQNLIRDSKLGPIEIEEDSDDEFGYPFETMSHGEHSDDEDEINEYKSFPKALEELDEIKNQLEQTSAELEQKKYELNQLLENLIPSLQNQLLAKDTEVKNLKTKLQEETDKLTSRLTEAQEGLKESQNHIASLKTEQIEELDQLRTHYEKSIQELNNQIINKKIHLKDLASSLSASDKQLQQLKQTFDSLLTEKLTLENTLKQLEQKNGELQQKLSQASAKDAFLAALEQEKTTNEKELQELQNKLKNLKEKLEISQTAYSDSNEKYAKLEKAFEEQSQQLNLITAELESSNAQLEAAHTRLENMKAVTTGARPLIQDELSSLKDEAFSEGSSSDPQSQFRTVLQKPSQSDEDSLNLNETEDELSKKTDSRPSSPIVNTSIPTSDQLSRDATLEEIKQGVNVAFKQENHPAIIDAFINKFLQIATDAANKSLNDNANSLLPSFEQRLKKIASDQTTQLIFPYINSPSFKTKIAENIHTNKLQASNYLEEVINSTELIFANLAIGEPAQNYKDNIADQGKNLLIKLCIENLQTNEKESLLELAKNSLEKQAAENHLLTNEYTGIIQRTTEELVTQLLKKENLQKTLEEIVKNPIGGLNLLVASQQKLQDQLVQKINQNFDHYFPNLHLDPILEKINHDKDLSSDETAKLPAELQYADTLEEFVSGLRVKYPNLSSSYKNKINEDTFKQLRLILRKNALNAFPSAAFEDKEILDLDAKLWLEKKLQQITNKSISLKLDEKAQKDLDNNFQKYFRLSPLEDMSITHKSIDELKNELKKLNNFKLKTATELTKVFSEIESKLPEYPHLITQDGSFQANLNSTLPDNFPKLSDAHKYPMLSTSQIQILLDKINQHDVSRWSRWCLLNSSNKIVQEIADNIISDSTNPFESSTDIQRIVSNSLTILKEFHGLKGTLEKRSYWDSEIQQRYALTQKLKSSSHFNQMVEDRISKLEEMLDLKENDADENVKALPKAVYLPNKCRVIPNFQFDSSEDPEEYHLQVDNFYKQDALKVGKTITFSQKLANEDECKWSATLNTDKCLSFKTQKKRFRSEKSYLQEVSFAQMIYSVNSFKDAKTCTLNFGNCSQNMKERLYLFAKAYNELRLEDNELQKRPKINCNIKNSPNLDKAKIAVVKEEIKAQLNLHSNELEDISTKLKDDTMRHQIIRSRG